MCVCVCVCVRACVRACVCVCVCVNKRNVCLNNNYYACILYCMHNTPVEMDPLESGSDSSEGIKMLWVLPSKLLSNCPHVQQNIFPSNHTMIIPGRRGNIVKLHTNTQSEIIASGMIKNRSAMRALCISTLPTY